MDLPIIQIVDYATSGVGVGIGLKLAARIIRWWNRHPQRFRCPRIECGYPLSGIPIINAENIRCGEKCPGCGKLVYLQLGGTPWNSDYYVRLLP